VLPSVSTSADYKPALKQDNAARSPDFATVEEFLQLLARAIRQFQIYPATSPLCSDAIAACHTVLATPGLRDQLKFTLTPREVFVDDIGVGAGTIIEVELVQRLHRAHVAEVDIDQGTSLRDLTRFCTEIARDADPVQTKTTLAELLARHGVTTIVSRQAHRPEMLDVGAPSAPLCSLVEHERHRRQAMAVDGPVSHLYPPDKGWVRLDPSAAFDSVSLVDLAILVDDPGEVATMLLRLTDDEPGVESREAALEHKFSDVATLFSALDSRLARVMFSKLARAVLALEPERRKSLLKRTILPGLLDGRADGNVLRDFPNVDLADSLCLLLDLETAAPELVTTALDRLQLPAEQREAVAPLLEARLSRETAASSPDAGGRDHAVDRHARRLIRIDSADGKSFSEFAAFDLSIDAQTTATLEHIRDAIPRTDVLLAQIEFLLNIVRLESKQPVVEAFLRETVIVFAELERADRLQDLAVWAARHRQLSETLRQSRPDVADAIATALVAFCTPGRALRLSALHAADAAGRATANSLVDAFGAAMAPAFVTLLDEGDDQARTRATVSLLCEHARLLAPAFSTGLGRCKIGARHAIVKVLGLAGPGYESALEEQIALGDEQVAREALRALAQIGSHRAAVIVGGQLRTGAPAVRAAAEEALRHLPPAQAAAQARDLLGHRDFVLRHPQVVVRLLDRMADVKSTGLEPSLRALAPLRFRFWSPAIARVGSRARALLRR
jgi:hypothetical protein